MNKKIPPDSLKSKSGIRDWFQNGLVFGFDMGTNYFGISARRGDDFLESKTYVVMDNPGGRKTADLKVRREHRAIRRALRCKHYRREWLKRELEKIGFSYPFQKNEKNRWVPKFDSLRDPVLLRVMAIHGEKLKSEEIHAAIAHLFRQRGYLDPVPWSTSLEGFDDSGKKETGEIRERMSSIRSEMKEREIQHPCELLHIRMKNGERCKGIVWPRELLEDEFSALVKAQKKYFPDLEKNAEWLMYGDTREYRKGNKIFHVYSRAIDCLNPGALGQKWPRFNNRNPGLDSLTPYDAQGRPLHVPHIKNNDVYAKFQFRQAVMNFRVVDVRTQKKEIPPSEFLKQLETAWKEGKEITAKWLQNLSKKYLPGHYELIEGQTALTPESFKGRASFSTPIMQELLNMPWDKLVQNPAQPILLRPEEDADTALNRILKEIRAPLVRHRLEVFMSILKKMIAKHGRPDMIIVEAARDIGMGKKKKEEYQKRINDNHKEREEARKEILKISEKALISPNGKNILKYRLWKEAGGKCPYCLRNIALWNESEIEHIVPQSRVPSSEWPNLTVAHRECNKEKDKQTPYEFFEQRGIWKEMDWKAVSDNAVKSFRGKKRELFLSPDAEELLESKKDLAQTAYLARLLRKICLVQMNWIGKGGHDPVSMKDNPALRFQVTNGRLTSRLRHAWGLDQVLYSRTSQNEWNSLSVKEQMNKNDEWIEKNRADLRNHALDAMVISCTLPWLAHMTHGKKDENGDHGWWRKDEKGRMMASNPIQMNYQKACEQMKKTKVQFQIPSKRHASHYRETLLGKREDIKNSKEPIVFISRKSLCELGPKQFKKVWPQELSEYLELAWQRWEKDAKKSEEGTPKTKKEKLEEKKSFASKLCFSHFQKWRAQGKGDFNWPEQVKIRMTRVRCVAKKDENSVTSFRKETKSYVVREEYKEVRIYRKEDGLLEPVFVPHWKGDSRYPKDLRKRGKPLLVLKKGQVVEVKKGIRKKGKNAGTYDRGFYRITVLGTKQITIIPFYLANNTKLKEAYSLYGIPKSGLKPYWKKFFEAIGLE